MVAEGQNKANTTSQDGQPVADIRHRKADAQNMVCSSDVYPSDPSLWTTDSMSFPMLLTSHTPNLKSLVITIDPRGLSGSRKKVASFYSGQCGFQVNIQYSKLILAALLLTQ